MTVIAGPISGPHPVDECYGSKLHCWTCGVDEPDQPCYRACGECMHVFRSAAELLEGHNKHLAVYGMEPATDPDQVFCCPHCVHDW